MSILIVDDSKIMRSLFESYLKDEGYKDILLARSAREAFEKLGMYSPSSVKSDVDLILMDIIMPGMDGIEACKHIKRDERFKDIPIIMVTASKDIANLQLAFAAGAMDYITKPLDKTVLLARVRSALKLKHEMDRRKAREEELMEVTRQLEAANQSLRRISSIDGLTGLVNRRHFEELLRREWRRAVKEGSPISFIMIDIDFFKHYNDTYGHLQGDECLKKIALALKGVLKRPGDIIARYGGEEFLAMLVDTDTKGALVVAEKMKSAVEKLAIEHSDSPISNIVTISLGISSAIPRRDLPSSALITEADKALYMAKEEGRNRIKIYSRSG
jgi:diguanylate cyclase (GGDEF)-like protein